MPKTDKARQQDYRRRMQEQGFRQVAVWLDKDSYTALQLLKKPNTDMSLVISEAIKHYRTCLSDKSVTSNVTSNVASNRKPVTSYVTSNDKFVTSNDSDRRYMSQALEDHILGLRQFGMTLKAVGRQLFDEGYLNARGEQYSTATISKAEVRAKARSKIS